MDSDAVPEGRCGFTLSPEDLGEDVADEYEDGTYEWYAWGHGIATCVRDTWEGTGRCIWHAETDRKPIGELREARGDGSENLAGSHLAGLDIDDPISFADCRLIASNFTQASLRGADLTDANLRDADLTDADLPEADLTDANLYGADLTDANLHEATLTDADLEDAILEESNLKTADFTDVDLTNADLTGANVEQANFTRTNFFGTDLTGARLYSALFADIQIDHGTAFGGHYDDVLDGADSEGDTEESDGAEEEEGEDDRTPWAKARWTYRQLEEIAQKNAHPEKARDYYVQRKDVRRREYHAEGGFWNRLKGLWMEGQRWVMGYGDRPRRVVGTSGVVIAVFGFLFPLFGGLKPDPEPPTDPVTFEPIATGALDLPQAVDVLLANLYFSGVTFTTLGYGDIQPATPAVEFLATVESFLGALLMALLVFVLGRRTTW